MGSRRLVVNASPLIFLAQIDQLRLLRELADEVVAPVAVIREVRSGEYRQLQSPEIDSVEWLIVKPDALIPPEIAGWDLGAGESQVLALTVADPEGSKAVLDDLQARHCAQSLGLALTGTLGVLLRSKQTGLVAAARPLVEELLRRGMYLSRELVDGALREVGD